MKKNYITPEINVIQPESLLCSGGFMVASVNNTNGEYSGHLKKRVYSLLQ